MLIFVNAYGSGVGRSKVILPLDRIYDIWEIKNKLMINYDSGEQIETLCVNYANENDATQAINSFYQACISNVSAFYFTDILEEQFDDEEIYNEESTENFDCVRYNPETGKQEIWF